MAPIKKSTQFVVVENTCASGRVESEHRSHKAAERKAASCNAQARRAGVTGVTWRVMLAWEYRAWLEGSELGA